LKITEETKDEELDDLFLQGLGSSSKVNRPQWSSASKFDIRSLIKDLEILNDHYLTCDSEKKDDDERKDGPGTKEVVKEVLED